ncbi:hypothetical protein L7F22_036930 [Adiantum nelumboides]|nr:hypothetical protein [Adiantum nelumboides]
MAENLQSPAMQERLEIDTSPPFQSVKAAVSMFGKKVNVRRHQPLEKPTLKNAQLHQLKEELAAVKLQLKEAEEAKAKAYEEVRDRRKLLEKRAQGCGDPCVSKQFESCNILSAPMMQDNSLSTDDSKQDLPFPKQSNESGLLAVGSEQRG